jgi:hypothetical protein
LLAIWRETRERVVPLFPELSRKLVEKDDGETALLDLLNENRTAWEGSGYSKGAANDRWVKMLYGDRGVEELEMIGPELLQRAHDVWDGVAAAKRAYATLGASRSAAPPEPAPAESAPSGEEAPKAAKKPTRKPREKKA